MPPALDHPSLNLIVLDETFITYKFLPDAEIPADIVSFITRPDAEKHFVSLTRTSEEVSLVCVENVVSLPDFDVPKWRCIKIKGPMEFELTGIMCDFTTPLKHAGIPIFAISTWNTDYVLIPIDKIHQAIEALRADGWKFE